MILTQTDAVSVLSNAFREKIEFSLDIPLIESGLRLESLPMIRTLVELEKITGVAFEQEDAFELFGLSVNQLVARVNELLLEAANS